MTCLFFITFVNGLTEFDNMKRIVLAFFVALMAVTTASATTFCTAVIRVLAIGNSFSEDAVEQNLHLIAGDRNTPMVIANMYIGGCSLDRHLKNIREDIHDYRYTKFDAEGNKQIRQRVALSEVIAEEAWDYISIQQVSGVSGQAASYANLGEIVAWIRANAPQAKLLFHQTWAYARTSTHRDFPKYDCDQDKMHRAICATVAQECPKVGITDIIPVGQAMDLLRRKTGDYDLTRDGYHLSKGVGRYLAACVWYQTLTGCDARKIKYRPDGSDPRTEAISDKQAREARKAAYSAVRKYARLAL